MNSLSNMAFHLVWARMPLSEKELARVPISHRYRPYLIVGEDNKNYYGFPSTTNSSIVNRFSQNDYLEIVKPDSNTDFSYITLYDCAKIPKENLIDVQYQLSNTEITQLMRKLSVSQNLKTFPCFIQQMVANFSLPILRGDIVKYHDSMYYLHSENYQDNFTGYSISKIPNANALVVEFDGMKWYIKPWQKETILSKEVTYCNYLNKSYSKLFNACLKEPPSPLPDEIIPNNIHNLWISSYLGFTDNSKKGIVMDKLNSGTILLLAGDNKRFAEGRTVFIHDMKSIEFSFEGIISDDKSNYLSECFRKR